MKKLLVIIFIFILIIIVGLGYFFSTSTGGYLRGSVKKSIDGKTYLNVIDDNGGGCGPMIVDGKLWPYKINEKGLISPGVHTIKCGGEIGFEIPPGVVFSFDYWGP